ncbi:hypothetical protein [Mucilaginibacter sp. CSA2-8R]|uniref:hypothetical protein n=1 Tax=Mucilaginibacter sp. CSA2-8R TaxID=3141542 RepID=UPI00315CD3FE
MISSKSKKPGIAPGFKNQKKCIGMYFNMTIKTVQSLNPELNGTLIAKINVKNSKALTIIYQS